jgi:hypothetical protein
MARIITYECNRCGSEIVVTEGLGSFVSPIYCCELQVVEVSKVEAKPKTKKKAVKKVAKNIAKKVVKKKVEKKKKPAKKTKR